MLLSDRLPVTDQIKYNPRAGRYTVGGRFVSEAEIDGLAWAERNALGTKLENLTKQLVNEKIDLPEWENRFADTLKKSHIRMAILASGGRQRTGLNSYGIAGRHLKEEYGYLNNFAQALANGELSEQQALYRSRLYAQSTAQTYYDVYHFAKQREGFKVGWRTTDPAAKHCRECPSYSNSTWTPIEQITPKGAKCSCRGNCRCRIRYRRF